MYHEAIHDHFKCLFSNSLNVFFFLFFLFGVYKNHFTRSHTILTTHVSSVYVCAASHHFCLALNL